MITDHQEYLARRERDSAALRPRFGPGRPEREQGVDGGAAPVRCGQFAVPSRRRAHAAYPSGRQTHHAGRHPYHRSAAAPHAGAEPRRRDRTAGGADPEGDREAEAAEEDEAVHRRRRSGGSRARSSGARSRRCEALVWIWTDTKRRSFRWPRRNRFFQQA